MHTVLDEIILGTGFGRQIGFRKRQAELRRRLALAGHDLVFQRVVVKVDMSGHGGGGADEHQRGPRQVPVFFDQRAVILAESVIRGPVAALGVVAADGDDVHIRVVQLALLIHGVILCPVFARFGIPVFFHRHRVAVRVHAAVDHHAVGIHPVGGDGIQLGSAIAVMGFVRRRFVVTVVLGGRTAHTEVGDFVTAA